MKKLLYLLSVLLLLVAVTTGYAQEDGGNFERIRALRVSFITEKVKLTPEQSAQFWPVYNKYQEERYACRKKIKENIQSRSANGQPIDNQTASRLVDEDINFQQQEVELRKKYKEQLLKIISSQQLVQLYEAERDFKKILLEQLNKK